MAKIETVTETPLWTRALRLAPDKLSALQEEIDRLVRNGILEKSLSSWSSPIAMVKKPSGKYRLCADFVSLNKVLKKTRYPLPNIHDFSVTSSGCHFFSCIDIVDAYYLIPFDPTCSHKLTISTSLGSYGYRYLPMGLATSSNCFLALMHEVLSGIPRVFVYLDDIFVMSETEEHRPLLHHVFERLRTHGLMVNPKKCVFGVDNLQFLGHHVSAEGLKPSKSNVVAIVNYERPQSNTQLRTFLGMVQFYARFVPHLAELLDPLYALTQSDCPARIVWTSESNACFQKVRDSLANSTVLVHPSDSARIELVTDASEIAMGGVLNQVTTEGCRPLAFWSKALSPHERKWSCFERELFACYSAIKHFRYFLESRDFLLKTDHKPISFIAIHLLHPQDMQGFLISFRNLQTGSNMSRGKLM